MALNRKIAYIDLSTGDIQTKPIPLEIRKKFLGGRGLDAYLLYNHTKKGCDPLGPENTLLISGGILTATCASANFLLVSQTGPRIRGKLGLTQWIRYSISHVGHLAVLHPFSGWILSMQLGLWHLNLP